MAERAHPFIGTSIATILLLSVTWPAHLPRSRFATVLANLLPRRGARSRRSTPTWTLITTEMSDGELVALVRRPRPTPEDVRSRAMFNLFGRPYP